MTVFEDTKKYKIQINKLEEQIKNYIKKSPEKVEEEEKKALVDLYITYEYLLFYIRKDNSNHKNDEEIKKIKEKIIKIIKESLTRIKSEEDMKYFMILDARNLLKETFHALYDKEDKRLALIIINAAEKGIPNYKDDYEKTGLLDFYSAIAKNDPDILEAIFKNLNKRLKQEEKKEKEKIKDMPASITYNYCEKTQRQFLYIFWKFEEIKNGDKAKKEFHNLLATIKDIRIRFINDECDTLESKYSSLFKTNGYNTQQQNYKER